MTLIRIIRPKIIAFLQPNLYACEPTCVSTNGIRLPKNYLELDQVSWRPRESKKEKRGQACGLKDLIFSCTVGQESLEKSILEG